MAKSDRGDGPACYDLRLLIDVPDPFIGHKEGLQNLSI